MYVCMYVCMDGWMYVCMYVCMCIYIFMVEIEHHSQVAQAVPPPPSVPEAGCLRIPSCCKMKTLRNQQRLNPTLNAGKKKVYDFYEENIPFSILLERLKMMSLFLRRHGVG